MAEIRALLIDLDGVLRRWPPEVTRRAELAGGLPAGAIARAAFAPQLLRPAITGRVSDEEWRASLVARLHCEHPDADVRGAVAAWSDSAGIAEEPAIGLVRRIRLRAPVVLVTNATSRLAADLDRLGLTGAFDAVVSSSEVGTAKPDPAILQVALRSVDVAAHAAAFVDDSAANVAAAEALGMAGHIYRELIAMREHLLRCGLLDAVSDGPPESS